MSLPDLNRLTDAVRQDRLTAGQEAQLHAYLASHPEERVPWEGELSLNQLLRHIADIPVSSNFTALVIERAGQVGRRQSIEHHLWRRVFARYWLPKTAALAAAACLALFGYHQHQLTVRRELARQEVARTLATMAVTGNSVELLENFDAIRRLAQVPHDVDRDLIAALQ